MISQLYQSRSGDGTKKFTTKDKICFGFDAIQDMFHREVQRIKTGNRVRVPGLKSNYIYRDAWTRLNVRPAKILQVCTHIVT